MEPSDNKDMKLRFTLLIMNWIRNHSNSHQADNFPLDIIQLIVNIFLYEKIEMLEFDEELKHPQVVLHDDKKRATSTRSSGACTSVMINCDPVKSGVHVWRIQVCTIYFLHCPNGAS